MAGALDWLDNLTSTIGDIAGRAVDAAGEVATAKIEAEQKRATMPDQTPVPATSPVQTAKPGIVVSNGMLLAVGAGVLILGVAFFVRRG